jgi:hypothetical protein
MGLSPYSQLYVDFAAHVWAFRREHAVLGFAAGRASNDDPAIRFQRLQTSADMVRITG